MLAAYAINVFQYTELDKLHSPQSLVIVAHAHLRSFESSAFATEPFDRDSIQYPYCKNMKEGFQSAMPNNETDDQELGVRADKTPCDDMIDRTLIVIPAFNEESSLESTLDELLETVPHCHYLVVNDGSTDRTEAICREHGFKHVSLPVNVGLSGAFQTGIKYAYMNGFDFVLQFDADGQHDPRFIPSILDQAENHDIVIGSRFITEKKPFTLRMIGSALITSAIRIASGTHLKDPTSGMRLFGKKSIHAFANDSNCGPEPDTLAYFIKKKKASVIEVPVTMRERMAGTSYLNAKAAILYMLRMTMSIVIIQPFRR